jgi:hypothetical protein
MRRYQRWSELLDDANATLKSKNADDRFVTAALLVSRYRSFIPSIHARDRKTEPVDAKLSSSILRALAEADWDTMEERLGLPIEWLFDRLGITAKDGWEGERYEHDENALLRAMKKWLADHADTYRIATFVQG